MRIVRATVSLASLVIATLAVPSQSYGAEIRPFRSGNWGGGAYTNDTTKKFSACTVNSRYNSGITMFVTVRRDYSWALGFTHPSWNLQPGRKITLSVAFDSLAPWTGDAEVIQKDFVRVEMSSNSRLVEQFRLAYRMTVQAEGQTYGFNLDGTARLVPELIHCTATELARERGEPLPQLAAAPPPAPPQRAPERSRSTPVANEVAAMRLATNLLLQAKFPNAQLIPPSDTPSSIKGNGVAWKADGLVGSVGVYDKAVARDAKAAASTVLESDTKECKGDLATSRSSDLVDNKIVTKAVSVCKTSNGVMTMRYFILDGDDIGWVVYTIGTLDTDDSTRPPPMPDSQFQNVALRSLSTR